jgi:hypothetical protein
VLISVASLSCGARGSLPDELLPAVDVEGRAGDRRVRHEVDGQRSNVGRANDASDRSGNELP